MWHACKTSVTFCDSQRQRHHDGICINDFTAVTNSPLHLRMFLSSGTLTDEHYLAHFHLVEMFTIGTADVWNVHHRICHSSKNLTQARWSPLSCDVQQNISHRNLTWASDVHSWVEDIPILPFAKNWDGHSHILRFSQARHSSDSY